MSDDDARNEGTRHDEEAARRAREDAAWQSIVDNYGERPQVDVPPPAEPEPPAPPAHLFAYEEPPELGPRSWTTAEDAFEGYVPPPPPPVPRPHGMRAVAWLGLFGVPTVVLVCIVLHVSLPSPLGFLGLVWFVGGFGYLVATMGDSQDPDRGPDDGAVV